MARRRGVSALALLALLVAITLSAPTLVLTPGERQTVSPDENLPRGAEFRMPREPQSRDPIFTDLSYPVDFAPVRGWHFRGDEGRVAGSPVSFDAWPGEVVCPAGDPSACHGFGIVRSLESWRTVVGPRSDGTYDPDAPDFSTYSALVISLRAAPEACCKVAVTSAAWVDGTLVVQANYDVWPSCPSARMPTEIAAVALFPKAVLEEPGLVEVRVHDFEVVCP